LFKTHSLLKNISNKPPSLLSLHTHRASGRQPADPDCQAAEAVLQLCGQAGENQVPDARSAVVQALGGPASTAITHIMVRE